MEHIKRILSLCNQINERRQILLDKDLNRYMLYPDSEKQAYRIIVELIQKLNNYGHFEDVKELYCELNKYIPDNDKKLKNVLLNEYEIAEGKIHLESFPRHIQLVMTLQCNLNCIMCNDKHENIFISDKELDDLIKIMPYMQFLTLRGGEVFYDKRIGKILDETYKNNVKLTIITNGLLLDDIIIDKLMRIDGGIVISIDSPFKNTYESIRIGASFDILKKNLKKINIARKHNKSKLHFTMNMVIMRKNYEQIEPALYFAKEYGFNSVVLAPVEGKVEGKNENFFQNQIDHLLLKKIEEKREYFDNIANRLQIKLENKLPSSIQNNTENIKIPREETIAICKKDRYISKNTELFCYAPFRQMFKGIDYCNPLCCCEIHKADLKQYDRENSILDCWNSNNMLFYRKKILEHNYTNCANVCLNSNYDNFEGKRILKWEI
jgi:MoaA/NifB/PqqE/SkfB family radical SAM enzyme